MMNKEQIYSEYQDLYTNLFSTLDKLKELIEKKEYQDFIMNPPDEIEDADMMYGDFWVLVNGIGEAYN